MKTYRLYIRLVFGGLRFHAAGTLGEMVSEQVRFARMGFNCLVMEV